MTTLTEVSYEAGGADYIVKPAHEAEIAARINIQLMKTMLQRYRTVQ